jgi:hypothetical protein
MRKYLGVKLLWILFSGNRDWWKKVLLRKHLLGPRMRCLENPPDPHIGSQIWSLLKDSLPLLQRNLTWVPGNGKNISIWKYSIMRNPLLLELHEVLPLKYWLNKQGKCALFVISFWSHFYRCFLGWYLGEIPGNLQEHSHALLLKLQVFTRNLLSLKNSRGWGQKNYNVKNVYVV